MHFHSKTNPEMKIKRMQYECSYTGVLFLPPYTMPPSLSLFFLQGPITSYKIWFGVKDVFPIPECLPEKIPAPHSPPTSFFQAPSERDPLPSNPQLKREKQTCWTERSRLPVKKETLGIQVFLLGF